jgi:hypothetical protein
MSDGTHRAYFEARLPDGTHELRTMRWISR